MKDEKKLAFPTPCKKRAYVSCSRPNCVLGMFT